MHIKLRIAIIGSVFVIANATNLSSQIRVMSYNLLNFPGGQIPDRIDTLSNILNYYRPHLFMIQELKSAAGLQDITTALNSFGYGDFQSAVYVSQQSDPGTSNPLQQSIIFDRNKFRLKKQEEIITPVRDINVYVLYLNDIELPNNADTTFIHVFVTHLKSSTGSANEQLRLQMVNAWQQYIDANLDSESNVIIAGDFNIYSNQEASYQELLSSANQVQMADVFASYGNWNSSNFAHKEILTQSTRFNQLANDGAGGGIDDRFDFILFSEQMLNFGNSIYVENESFKSLGNNGTCYNNSITFCNTSNVVPNSILQSLYYMSDHLPQVCTLNTSIALEQNEISDIRENIQFDYSGNSVRAVITSAANKNAHYIIRDMRGRIISEKYIYISEGLNRIEIDQVNLSSSVYFFALYFDNTLQNTGRFITE